MERLKVLKKLFKDINDDVKAIIEPLLPQVVFMESELDRLNKEIKTLQARLAAGEKVHSHDPIRKAPREYQQTMQAYINAVKVLQVTLSRAGATEESPLAKALAAFEKEYR